MFRKLDQKNNLGIDRYKHTAYAWETALLRGSVTSIAEKPDDFSVMAEPHLDSLRALDAAANQLTAAFDAARNTTLLIGHFTSLEHAEQTIRGLEDLYHGHLRTHGAAARVLRDGRLRVADHKTAATFGDALKQTRQDAVIALLRGGKPVPFGDIAGRLLRPLVNLLNVPYTEETERHADDPRRLHSVALAFEGLARFTFIDNGPDSFPTIVRDSFSENKRRYLQTYSGPGTLENMNKHVFLWLADALRERTPECDVAPMAQLIREISHSDLMTYAAPGNQRELWRAIHRGQQDHMFNGPAALPQPGAMLAASHKITGVPVGAKPVGENKGFLRLVK